ncbi:MAG: hypothetical protein QOD72_3179, partial [Acidimicrobiaceae bacterium]|nr:hypothetical protein [Acidimicrobiaceae bacterium]
FGVDPAEFVAARDRVARELKAAGRTDESKAVRGLRRPTVPVWALNQVAQQATDDLDQLFEASDAARAAQDQALAGGGGEELRDALARRRAAMRTVVHRARDIVEGSGRSGKAQEREIELTLTAVVDSPERSGAVRRGELTDVGASEDDDDLVSMFAPAGGTTPRTAKKAAKKATKPAPRDDLAEKRRKVAQGEVARAQAEVSEMADQLADAEGAVEAADAALVSAQDAARAAKDEAGTLRRAHTKAVAALERAQRALAKLET